MNTLPLFQSVILADDDVEDHEIFQEALLEAAPFVTLSFTKNGNELMRLLQHYVPDFIFLDMDMPGLDGLQCLRHIRTSSLLQSVHVIMFSGGARPVKVEMAYEMGADLFIVKPDNFQELTQVLSRVLTLDWSNPSTAKEQYLMMKRTAKVPEQQW
jgi:CheY-like chemotaxis protein